MHATTRFIHNIAAATVLASGVVLSAQSGAVADIAYDANSQFLKLPDTIHLGEVAGVSTNSKGHVFVYTRTGPAHAAVGASRTFYKSGSRLLQFDPTGKFVREIGAGVYGLNFAQQVRVDPQDNIWVVDQGSTNVIKFNPEGHVELVLSRKPEAINVRPATPPAGGAAPAAAGGRGTLPPGAGIPGDNFQRTADVAWDRAGNIYVADGVSTNGNARVAKFDKNGDFIKSWGQRGSEPGQFNVIRGIVVDGQGNVYVADAGNKRIQVFDGDGNVKRQITNIGTPYAICLTGGSHQYLYSSNSNEPDTLDNGEIYKMELDGKIVGKFGRAGHLTKEFGTVNAIDCRNENELLVGEVLNWRVQKVMLKGKR